MKFYLVTCNEQKVSAAKMFFDELGVKEVDCPEIQHKDVEKIVAHSARWASQELDLPVIVNDCAFEIDVLDGFPGAFAAYVERWIGLKGFLKLMEDVENRSAQFRDATAVCLPDEEPTIFTSLTRGKIIKERRGKHGWGVDKIFSIDGKTLGEYTDSERVKQYNNEHWKEAAEYCKKI